MLLIFHLTLKYHSLKHMLCNFNIFYVDLEMFAVNKCYVKLIRSKLLIYYKSGYYF